MCGSAEMVFMHIHEFLQRDPWNQEGNGGENSAGIACFLLPWGWLWCIIAMR
jgi:hypothetical protein